MPVWLEVAPQYAGDPTRRPTSINSMIEYAGALYATTGPYGYFLRWDEVDDWVYDSQVPLIEPNPGSLTALTVFNDELYGGTYVAAGAYGGGLVKYDPVAHDWTLLATKAGHSTMTMAVFKGQLFSAGGVSSELYVWDGASDWDLAAPVIDTSTTGRKLIVWENKLYLCGSSYYGRLYEYDEDGGWITAADTYTDPGGTVQTSIEDLIIYQGLLYGCTRTNTSGTSHTEGHLLRYDVGVGWVPVALSSSYLGMSKLCIHGTRLFGVGETGLLWTWNDVDAWVAVVSEISALNGQWPIYIGDKPFISYDDNLYIGSYNLAKLFVLNGWTPGTGAETGQTLAVNVANRTWRSIGHKVDAMHYSQETDQLVASVPFDGYDGTSNIIAELEVPGWDSITVSYIDFEVETKHLRLHPDQPVNVRWVHIDADTQDQDLTVTLVLDGTDVALGTLSTDGRTRTTFPTNRWGRLAGVRLESTEITDQVKIYGIEIEHHDTQGTLP